MEREQMALSVAPSQSARNMSDAGSPADFGKLIAKETETWGKEVKFAGLKPERSGNLACRQASAPPLRQLRPAPGKPARE
jgi:hypothetical protein